MAGESRFLKLPLEVRLHLYELMLTFSCREHVNLLCVNKQVYGEARESFYQRPLCLASQYDLVEFAARCSANARRSFKALHLQLEEIRPEFMQEFLAGITSGNPVQARRHPYVLEIDRVTAALSEFPGVIHLELLRPTDVRKSLPSSIVTTQVLQWIAQNYTRLQSIKLDAEECHIDCFGSLTKLRSIRLTGYSETSSLRTADVLSRISGLEELIVTGPAHNLQASQQHVWQPRVVQSIAHHTLQRIRPLKRLTLVENTDTRMDSDGLLTSRMIKALFEVHQESLKVLKISSRFPPKTAFVKYLSAFLLEATNVETLSLTWPEMELTFVDCIPNSVRRLELAVTSRDEARATLDRLQLMAYRLRYLRDVKFHIINPVHESSTGAQADKLVSPLVFTMPIQNLSTYVLTNIQE